MWLPESDDRPIRPDLPWLRNLSWVKIHAMQIGFAVGLIVYWGQAIGKGGIAFGVAVLVFEIAVGEVQETTDLTAADHDLGIHDLREKPWYGISAAVATWIACSLAAGIV